MKIRLEGTSSKGYPTVEICCESDELTIGDVIENLVKPALLAWGFHPNNVRDYLDQDYTTDGNRTELIYEVGKLAMEEGEAWRLAHAELMDAYHAVHES